MSIKVTFEFETADEAIAFLADSASDKPATPGASAGKPRGRPRNTPAAPAPDAPAAQPAAAASAATAASPAATVATGSAGTAAVPFKAVADAITELADVDLAKAKAVLGNAGVAKASDLKPDQYAAVVAAAKAAMAPTPAAVGLI